MRSRRGLAGLSLGAVAASLAVHAVGAWVALFSDGPGIAATMLADDTIVAEFLPPEPAPVSAESLARAAARGRASQTAARPARPHAAQPAPAAPSAIATERAAEEDVVALVPASPDPQYDSDPPPMASSPPAAAVSEPHPIVAREESGGADSPQETSPGADVAQETADSPAPAATEAEVTGARAQVSEGGLMHGPTLLPEAPRSVLEDVATRASVSMRAEAEPFLTRRAVFEFLLDHPDFATHVTRALKVGRYRIWRTDEGLFLDDGWGATGRLAILHRTAGTRVMYAKGQYEALLLPRIRGEAVVVIEYVFRAVGGGMDLVSAAITSYVTLESRALAVAARVANGAAARKADAEARKLLRSFAKVSRAIDENPEALVAQLRARPEVPTRELGEFTALLGVAR